MLLYSAHVRYLCRLYNIEIISHLRKYETKLYYYKLAIAEKTRRHNRRMFVRTRIKFYAECQQAIPNSSVYGHYEEIGDAYKLYDAATKTLVGSIDYDFQNRIFWHHAADGRMVKRVVTSVKQAIENLLVYNEDFEQKQIDFNSVMTSRFFA